MAVTGRDATKWSPYAKDDFPAADTNKRLWELYKEKNPTVNFQSWEFQGKWKETLEYVYNHVHRQRDWWWQNTDLLVYETLRRLLRFNGQKMRELGHVIPPSQNEQRPIDTGFASWLKKHHSEWFEEQDKSEEILLRLGLSTRAVEVARTTPPASDEPQDSVPDQGHEDVSATDDSTNTSVHDGEATDNDDVHVTDRVDEHVEQGRLARLELFRAFGSMAYHIDAPGHPFEVRVPDDIGRREQSRLFRRGFLLKQARERCDRRLRIVWTEHDGATFLVVVKNRPHNHRSLLGMKEAYMHAFESLKGYCRELERGSDMDIASYMELYHR